MRTITRIGSYELERKGKWVIVDKNGDAFCTYKYIEGRPIWHTLLEDLISLKCEAYGLSEKSHFYNFTLFGYVIEAAEDYVDVYTEDGEDYMHYTYNSETNYFYDEFIYSIMDVVRYNYTLQKDKHRPIH